MVRILMMLLMCLSLTACYYMQAASGQWEVTRKRESIEKVIEDPDTSPELANRLRLLDEARDFSIAELGLPDNKSYRSYAELERDYVVWNVFAAPEFSLQPKQWCFPIAGCVSYRGYFAKEDATKLADRLSEDGYDVAVGGVAAYSTLGNFSDPILSTMMHWEDVDLVAMLFHELAHQVIYVKNDSGFNESFATAVEEIGVRRWLQSRGEESDMTMYLTRRERQQQLASLIESAKIDLEPIYDSDISDDDKRTQKRLRLQTLSGDISQLLKQHGISNSSWFDGELDNAQLISTSLYEGKLPVFREIYEQCGEEIDCFYETVNRLVKDDLF